METITIHSQNDGKPGTLPDWDWEAPEPCDVTLHEGVIHLTCGGVGISFSPSEAWLLIAAIKFLVPVS